MSKKEALGSIPTFENVARATEDLDLFKDATEPKKEEIKESKEDLAKKLKEEMKQQLLKEAEEKKQELKKETKQPKKRITDEEIKKAYEEAEQEEEETPRSTEKKPSTKVGLKAGYKRQTFVIREDLLEVIQALSFVNKEVSQAKILEALLERGLADINEDVKEKALASYRKEKKENKEEQEKKDIEKLFK